MWEVVVKSENLILQPDRDRQDRLENTSVYPDYVCPCVCERLFSPNFWFSDPLSVCEFIYMSSGPVVALIHLPPQLGLLLLGLITSAPLNKHWKSSVPHSPHRNTADTHRGDIAQWVCVNSHVLFFDMTTLSLRWADISLFTEVSPHGLLLSSGL